MNPECVGVEQCIRAASPVSVKWNPLSCWLQREENEIKRHKIYFLLWQNVFRGMLRHTPGTVKHWLKCPNQSRKDTLLGRSSRDEVCVRWKWRHFVLLPYQLEERFWSFFFLPLGKVCYRDTAMEVTDEKADFACRKNVGRAEKVEDISCRTVAGLAAIFVHALLQRPMRKIGICQ